VKKITTITTAKPVRHGYRLAGKHVIITSINDRSVRVTGQYIYYKRSQCFGILLCDGDKPIFDKSHWSVELIQEAMVND